ncbi:MAG: hypothetical protein COB69_00505 [Phycisphaera sp.]|nr:MAG: hypothetical protein COB69_00505 [Phycisphaera sp.]
MVHIGWIFSLVRSGSSAAGYAAAAPWDLPVADELFGPWDRTGPPHNMPKRQAELARAFRAVGNILTAEIVGLAHDILRELAQRDNTGKGWVVCKCPHLMFTPKDFNTWFGATSAQGIVHHQAHLIRNPIRRANSCYARGWEHMLNDPYELGAYRTFMQRWNDAETKLRFEDMRTEPSEFFHALYEGWGLAATDSEIQRACDYLAEQYHDSSAQRRTLTPGFVPQSETNWAAPGELLDVYLADDEIHSFMQEQGWPTNRSSYEGWLPRKLWRALKGKSPGISA